MSRTKMSPFTFLLLFCIGTVQLVSSADDECSQYSTPLEKRLVIPSEDPSNIRARAFGSLSFRANNYGSSRYKLEASINGGFQLSIEMDNGPRPDSVKGGGLNGFYALYRSFITRRRIMNLNDKETGLEIWNVYVRKNNSAEAPSAHNIVSLNVEFEIGDRPNNQINLIISAMKKLSLDEPKTLLSYNYDLYEFLPLQTSFGIYETTKFPFVYPDLAHPHEVKSGCGPIIQVYRFNSPLIIAKRQFDEFLKYEQDLKNQFVTKNGQDLRENEFEISDSDISGELGKIFLTPDTEHLLFRRLVAESYIRNPDRWGDDTHAGGPITADKHQDDMDMEDDYEDEEGEGGGRAKHLEARTLGPLDPNDPNSILAHQQPIIPHDEGFFPKDCVFLFKIHDDLQKRQHDRIKARKGGAGSHSSMSLLITLTTVGVTVMSACN